MRASSDEPPVDLIAFPFHDWRKGDREGRRWRDAHLIDAFADLPAVGQILVIDRPVSLAERLVRRQPGWARGRVVDERADRRSAARLTAVRDDVSVLDIHVPDLVGPILRRRGWWFDAFEGPRVIEHIRWAVDRSGVGGGVVVAWQPAVAPAIAAIAPGAVLFNSLDNWLIHPSLRTQADRAIAGYQSILPGADAVVASAPASREVLLRWAPRVEVVPNGVDPTVFQGVRARPADLPAGPIVGYAGTLAERIDADLVASVARALPDRSFVFIGHIRDRASVRPMRGIPNVHILGDRHYDRLPDYLASFDVAWIPHAVGPGETGGDPLKMYEYWAAGLEVIATRIDGLDRWADRLHLVDDAGDAARVIRGLLDGTVEPVHAQVPADRTWPAIAGHMLGLLARPATARTPTDGPAPRC